METILHLVRHGQTDWNLEGRYQGRIDIPLNKTGISQAKKAAEKLAGGRYTAIYSSTLTRARQTAEIIAKTVNLPVTPEAGLQEIYQGEWEGKIFKEILASQPDKVTSVRANPYTDRPPGGESIGEVGERLKITLDKIVKNHLGEEIIIVSHGMAIGTVLCTVEGIGLEQAVSLIPQNSEIKKVTWKHSG